MDALASLSNEQLLAQLPELRSRERRAIAEVIVCLAEVDRRRLFLREACSSLYTFCIERLGYSEDAARKRMRVARLYRELPQVLDELTSGSIHLTGLFLLSGHLTEDNADPLLAATRGKTRREIELVIARWFPKPDVLPSITPLGADSTGPGTEGSPHFYAASEALRIVAWRSATPLLIWSGFNHEARRSRMSRRARENVDSTRRLRTVLA